MSPEDQQGREDHEVHEGIKVFERQNQAPNVEESESHTVLFNLPLPKEPAELPVPRAGSDVWDSDHVKLPTSPTSKYREIDEDGEMREKPRWELIRESLTAAKISDSKELEKAIKKYFTKFNSEFDFVALHELFESTFLEIETEYFFESVLHKIIELALRLPELHKSPIPFLKSKMNHSISLSQEQVGCLLANAFLCTFPARNMSRGSTDYPEINFNRLFSTRGDNVLQKLKCVCNYFRRICVIEIPTGVVTFQRRYINPNSFPKVEESDELISSIIIEMSPTTKIEECAGMLQVDFANRFLGGGALGRGCVQEEIRFMINPEMIVGMLFCECMNSTEAILMTGCEQFNQYTGYASSFNWKANFKDETPRDAYRRKMTYVVAIDATNFHNPRVQFKKELILREIRKASVGYYHNPEDSTKPIPVASGNWGCGAFRGSKKLKALIQIIACCLNRRNLFYCSFGETELIDDVMKMFEYMKLKNFTIGTLFRYLQDFQDDSDQPDQLYKFIRNTHFTKVLKPILFATMADSDEETTEEGTETATSSHQIETEGIHPTENPPAKKRRISEGKEDVGDDENGNLENIVNMLNGKLQDNHLEKPAADHVVIEIETVNEVEEPAEVSPTEEESTANALENPEKGDEGNSAECESKQDAANLLLLMIDKSTNETSIKATKGKITDFFKPKT